MDKFEFLEKWLILIPEDKREAFENDIDSIIYYAHWEANLD